MMDRDMMKRIICCPLKLRGITLRGIKSYLHGARLDIQPLTILCGANATGKSTWIEVLDLLRHSVLARKDYPGFLFTLKPKEGRPVKPEEGRPDKPEEGRPVEEFANAYLRHQCREVLEKQFPPGEDDETYGPLGTIGLEARASYDDWYFGESNHIVDRGELANPTRAAELLQRGVIREGTRLRIRITDPELSPWGEGLWEFSVKGDDDKYEVIFRFRKPQGKDRYEAFVSPDVFGLVFPTEVKQPKGLCSIAQVALDPDTGETDIEVNEALRREAHGQESDASTSEDFKQACERGWRCLPWFLGEILYGVFSIGAIRRVLKNAEIDESLKPDDPGRDFFERAVGADGHSTYDVCSRYCDGRMVQGHSEPPHSGFLSPDWDWLSNEFKPDVIRAFKERTGLEEDEPVQAYLFETFFGVWMKYLVDAYPTPEGQGSHSLSHCWINDAVKPGGFSLDHDDDELREKLKSKGIRIDRASYDRYFHPCLYGSGTNVPPGQLSSGFHQVAPIVVQAGVMRRNETMCIENPEVHLHPRLQGKICEFLINEVLCGKQFIVETHSDLVVYRIMRAMLEETLRQGAVHIYFTRLEPPTYDGRERAEPGTRGMPAYSKVEQIEIDDYGRIKNWPPGFLDEQVAEARRLLDIRYSSGSEPDGEEP